MTLEQIRRRYCEYGLGDFILTNVADLKNIHGFDYDNVAGYDELDEFNKARYKTFIVNYFNAHGVDKRISMRPIGIYYVEETTAFFMDENGKPIENFSTINIVKKDGSVGVTTNNIDCLYEGKLIKFESPKRYLRFEYSMGKGKNVRCYWLQITHEGHRWTL